MWPRPDPRVRLGALALRGSVAAEQKTPEGAQTPKDRKSYIPRDMPLSYLQARQEEATVTGVKFAERAGLAHGFDYHFVTEFLAELTSHLFRRVRFTIPQDGPRIAPLATAARIIVRKTFTDTDTDTDTDGDVWRTPGFTVVDLDGAVATVRCVDVDGTLWREPDTL